MPKTPPVLSNVLSNVLSKRFQLGDRIAAGGMACVFEGEAVRSEDALAGRPLAIKVLHDHLAENSDFVRMFRDEGNIAARFEHVNVVRVYAVGEDAGRHYMVMDRIFGHNLAEVLQAYRKRRRRVPKGATFEILRQMLSALVYVHGFKGKGGRRLGIVHRDISPHNILIAADEKVRLTDFGIARGSHRSDQTRTGTIKGKLHYMSPEQARGKRVDARADLYALGAVAWELYTERPLLQADRTEALQARVMSGEFDLESPRFDALSADLQAWLRKSLAVDKDDRWQSAEAMQAALGNVKGASNARFKPGALARLLDIFDVEEQPEQPSLLSDAEMAPQRKPSRVASSAEAAASVLRTPQRPISRVFVGPETVSKVRRLSGSERLQGLAPQLSSDSLSDAKRPSRRSSPQAGVGRSRSNRPSSAWLAPQDASAAAVRHSALISLQAAGADLLPGEEIADPAAAPPVARSRKTACDRVSRVLVQQQRGVAVAAMVAWSCVALLLFGTLLEVWNARVHLPRVDKQTFAGLLDRALATAAPAATVATAAESPTESVAAPPRHPSPAPRTIRNDRFVPRGAHPIRAVGVTPRTARTASPGHKRRGDHRAKPSRKRRRRGKGTAVVTGKAASQKSGTTKSGAVPPARRR